MLVSYKKFNFCVIDSLNKNKRGFMNRRVQWIFCQGGGQIFENARANFYAPPPHLYFYYHLVQNGNGVVSNIVGFISIFNLGLRKNSQLKRNTNGMFCFFVKTFFKITPNKKKSCPLILIKASFVHSLLINIS